MRYNRKTRTLEKLNMVFSSPGLIKPYFQFLMVETHIIYHQVETQLLINFINLYILIINTILLIDLKQEFELT